MSGRRVPDGTPPHTYSPGDYGRWWPEGESVESSTWYCSTPTGGAGNLAGHEVVEHDDGTITVSPSILVSTTVGGERRELWHGWLERGVWREA